MDLLSQHEAFLRAIYDAPDDDTARLVYADFLEENGSPQVPGPGADLERGRFRADLIRAQCELARAVALGERRTLVAELDRKVRDVAERAGAGWPLGQYERGFPVSRLSVNVINVSLAGLLDTTDFRLWSVVACPQRFAATVVRVTRGRITDGRAFDALFGIPALSRITSLDLSGGTGRAGTAAPGPFLGEGFEIIEPVITTAGVEALVRHRGVKRITALDLRNNNLDNDAAHALVRSPYLDNLKRLQLLEGNRLRGKVWQQVIERFGEDVVG